MPAFLVKCELCEPRQSLILLVSSSDEGYLVNESSTLGIGASGRGVPERATEVNGAETVIDKPS